MLAIRLQRTGRSGHAHFRMIVQDSRFSPSGGRVVAYLGSYDPHSKSATIDGEQASKYLLNGAQPSDRAARILQKEGIKLPAWVKLDEPRKRDVRNPEKRRSTAPAQPEAPAPEAEAALQEAPADTETEAPQTAEEPVTAEEPAPEAPADQPEAKAPAKEASSDKSTTEEPAAE